jgi:hypothetical protein
MQVVRQAYAKEHEGLHSTKRAMGPCMLTCMPVEAAYK